jgi:putative acetyltransferase
MEERERGRVHNRPVQVRHERAGDEEAIRDVNDKAFGQSDESRIVDTVRAGGHAALSLVAVVDHRIVGHILFTPVEIERGASAHRAFGLGPMAVLPACQRQGIGSALVQSGLRECTRLGGGIVVVVGHPAFYRRFGFRRAVACGLRLDFEVPDEAFMVMELTPGSLAAVRGLVRYVPAFGA